MIIFERGANGRNELVVVGRTVPVWLLIHLLQEGVSERDLLETFTALVPENLGEARQLYECEGHRQLIDWQIRNHRDHADADRMVIYSDFQYPPGVHCYPTIPEHDETIRGLQQAIRLEWQRHDIKWMLNDACLEQGFGDEYPMFIQWMLQSRIGILVGVLIRLAPGMVVCGRCQDGIVRSVRLPIAVWEQFGRRIFLVSALTHVEITDRRPQWVRLSDSQARFRWNIVDDGSPQSADASLLPQSIFVNLPRYRPEMRFLEYNSEGEAVAGLSEACLQLASKTV